MRDNAPPEQAHQTVARNAVYLLIGQIASFGFSIALSAALGRGLGVVEFGNYFFYMTVATFVYVIVEWGQSAYLVREAARRPTELPHLLSAAAASRVVIAAVLVLPVAFLMAVTHEDERVGPLTLLAIAAGLPLALSQAWTYVFRAQDRMELDAAVGVAGKAVTVVLTIAALHYGAGLSGVFAMQAAGGLVALLVAVVFARRLGIRLSRPHVATGRELFVGGAPLVAFFLALAIQPFLDALLLSWLAPAEVMGWYGAARSIVALLFVPAVVIGTAAFPQMSRLADQPQEFALTVRTALRLMVGLGALAATGTYLFSHLAVTIIFGAGSFDAAAVLLKWYAPLVALLFLDNLFGTTLTALGKTKEIAVVKLASIVVGGLISLVLIPLFQVRYGNGAIGLIIALLVSELLMLTAFLLLLPSGIANRGMLADVCKAAAAAVATTALLSLVPELTPWIAVPGCVVLFAAASFAFGLVRPADVKMLSRLSFTAR